MTSAWIARVAAWLLPDDERGAATLGDLIEIHEAWREQWGGAVASLLLVGELLRSLPRLATSAFSQRGAARLLGRSVPALVVGCLIVMVPAALGGASAIPAVLGAALAFAASAALATTGGWVAAAVAGAAPRQHGLSVGVALAAGAAALSTAGRISPPLVVLVAWQLTVILAAGRGGARRRRSTIGQRPAGGGRHGLATGRSALALALLLPGTGCDAPRGDQPAGGSVTRHFLSGNANDWEPTLAIGPNGRVHVMALRRIGPPPEPGRPGEQHIVTWSSHDGGTTFGPAYPYAYGGGDPRMVATRSGTLFASWIRIEWDSAGGVDLDRGGLVLATSHDDGATWETTLAATMPSGVADKPELAVSPDGQDVYIAFMARGTLDVVASHDGGASWERHTADSTLTGHWPSGIALAPDGDLVVANVKRLGTPQDSLLIMALELLRSTDRGAGWDGRVVARATRSLDVSECVHGPTCPVQIPYLAVATDEGGHAYAVYTHGSAGRPYGLELVRSQDGGATWSEPTVLSAAARSVSGDSADHYYPMIAAAGRGLVYVAWFDDRDGPIGLWARRSDDGGLTWSADVRLSDPQGLSGIYGEYGGIGIDAEGSLHVAWSDGTGHIGRAGGMGGTWYARWERR